MGGLRATRVTFYNKYFVLFIKNTVILFGFFLLCDTDQRKTKLTLD